MLIPKLQKVCEQAPNDVDGFFLFSGEQYKDGKLSKSADAGTFGQGKYPRRLKKFKAEPEDLPIYFKGHHIGHFIAKIPWLHL